MVPDFELPAGWLCVLGDQDRQITPNEHSTEQMLLHLQKLDFLKMVDVHPEIQYYLTNIVKLVKQVLFVAESDNLEREKRILDAAAGLFMHYGFDKTTVSDIARQAGVSKGAIYLHFESKDSLFEALLLRELQAYAESWLALIEADPLGGTIGGMYKNSLYALNSNPFMSAVFRQDGRILGNYLRKEDNLLQNMTQTQGQSPRQIFVQKMQEAGVVRDDLDANIIAHIMTMLSYSLVSMDDILPAQEIPPVDALIEGIAVIMDQALMLESGNDSAAGKQIIRELFATGRQILNH